MSSDVDDFTNNANDSTINVDDCLIDLEPHNIDEGCGELEAQEHDCDFEEPFADNNFQPYTGMEFPIDREAYKFYNIYRHGELLSFTTTTASENRNLVASLSA